MAHTGRIACIFTPYLLTIASLVCIVIVGLGCVKATSGALGNVYFIRVSFQFPHFALFEAELSTQCLCYDKVNLQNITSNGTKSITEIEDILGEHNVTDIDAEGISDIVSRIQDNSTSKDFYQIGLWGYCDGYVSNGNYNLTDCSKPKSDFYFDPLSVWGLNNDSVLDKLPNGYHKFSKTYKAVIRWMSIAYILAFVTTILEIAVGIFAVWSRWSSCVTTLFAVLAFLFTTAASATSTAIFLVIRASAGAILAAYGIRLSIGKHILAATWIATLFSLVGLIFWVFSVCCCAGHPHSHSKRERRSKMLVTNNTPYNYEPLSAGAMSYGPPQANWPSYPSHPVAGSYPMHPIDGRMNAQEPFRHA
jgi:hypothetical protein